MSAFRTESHHGGDSDRAKVAITPHSTKVTSGTEVQEKLIVVAQRARSFEANIWPQRFDKMLYKTDGTTAVTNDGAKIVAELLVRHPVTK